MSSSSASNAASLPDPAFLLHKCADCDHHADWIDDENPKCFDCMSRADLIEEIEELRKFKADAQKKPEFGDEFHEKYPEILICLTKKDVLGAWAYWHGEGDREPESLVVDPIPEMPAELYKKLEDSVPHSADGDWDAYLWSFFFENGVKPDPSHDNDADSMICIARHASTRKFARACE